MVTSVMLSFIATICSKVTDTNSSVTFALFADGHENNTKKNEKTNFQLHKAATATTKNCNCRVKATTFGQVVVEFKRKQTQDSVYGKA